MLSLALKNRYRKAGRIMRRRGENWQMWVQDGVGRYEYSYDLLGRVVQSVEHRPDNPSGDTTVYTYTPVGRLESEVRTGQVAYSRSYGYNPDGSRAEVMRSDALNGTHWDFYFYEAASGRLQSVLDVWSGEVNEFVWNPEGTLARWWNSEPNSYARVFSYDEEGRLTRIERDYGNGNLQTAYAYGYNGDGIRVWKHDTLNQQEYRYLCRIGCGGVPMRVYQKESNNARWTLLEEYLQGIGATVYTNSFGSFVDLPFTFNNWLFELEGQSRSEMIVRDSIGSTVRLYWLDFPPPHYLPDDSSSFSPQALKWALIIGGVVIMVGAAIRCKYIAEKTQEEVWKWEDEIHYDHGAGADKLAHCVAACLITLRAGMLCAILAARSTERGGNPFGRLTEDGDPMDEKANFDGVNCGASISRCRNFTTVACIKSPWVTGNDWLDCQSCCRQKGYRGRVK